MIVIIWKRMCGKKQISYYLAPVIAMPNDPSQAHGQGKGLKLAPNVLATISLYLTPVPCFQKLLFFSSKNLTAA